jgi:oxygen-independent coproporphyrinogen-3 oxidase
LSGIYIHIPFCKQACNYCDFHFSTQLNNKAELVNSISLETGIMHSYLKDTTLSSIYFGGGTPSLLNATELELILNSIRKHFSFSDKIEITLEANPDDINQSVLKNWMSSGINRLSIGLQSFNNDELRWMNRAHSAEESLRSVKLSQDAGFNNITIDLIYGSRFQDMKTWERTLEQAVALDTQHLSSYNLTIENKTRLGHQLDKGLEPAVNDDLSSRQFLLMSQMLEDAGFIHYEISNFGKPGLFAVHNSNYWLGKHYLGLGPSAHSFNGATRHWNVKNNHLYIQKVKEGSGFFETEELSLKDRYNEYVLTRLRTIWGCDTQEMKHMFGEDVVKHFLDLIKTKSFFVDEKSGVYALNKEGRLQADGIAADLFLD